MPPPEAVARPVTARSVIASILLPLDRPALPVRSLVRCCELFGITEGTTRVALSRMVGAGELQAGDGDYHLTGRMLERQARQQAARHPRLVPWSGQWVVAVQMVPEGRPAGRVALRQVMLSHRLAEVRPGVWARPDNLPELVTALREVGGTTVGDCLWLKAELDPAGSGSRSGPTALPGSDAALAARLWDLTGWATEAHRLLAALGGTLPALVAGDTRALAPCFSVAAAGVRHITADPLLPEDLLPEGWPAPELRTAYDVYEATYARVLTGWLSDDSAPG